MRRFAVFLALLSACSRDAWPDEDAGADAAAVDTPKPEEPANILLVIGDDMGLDASVCHQVAADPGRAPRIQSICARGVVFDNAWATPLCSPTRASILTGRHSFRTTVGTAGRPLPLSERALPRALVEGNAQYAVAAVGGICPTPPTAGPTIPIWWASPTSRAAWGRKFRTIRHGHASSTA